MGNPNRAYRGGVSIAGLATAWRDPLRLFVAVLMTALTACSTPGSKENLEATRQIVAPQAGQRFEWQRDAESQAAARLAVDQLLADGLSLDDSVAAAFLASPELQLVLEELEVSRAELVAASTLQNPGLFVGVRKPGGALAVFYPERNISVGFYQNVLALLTLPGRRAAAKLDLDRARLAAADRIATLAEQASARYFDYVAAIRIREVRERAAAAARAVLDTLVVRAANQNGVSDLDVAIERNQVYAMEGALTRATLEVETARAKLIELMGLNAAQTAWQATDRLQALPAQDPALEALQEVALRQRFDLRAARQNVLVRLQQLSSARRFRWLGGLELGMFRDAAPGGTSFWGPNLAVELPLFDQRQAQLLAGDAEWRAAMQRLTLTEVQARSALQVAEIQMRSARRLLEQLDREVLPNHRLIQSQLGNAADPGDPDRLRLRGQALTSEEDYVLLQRDYWQARSALALAAGDWSGLNGFSK